WTPAVPPSDLSVFRRNDGLLGGWYRVGSVTCAWVTRIGLRTILYNTTCVPYRYADSAPLVGQHHWNQDYPEHSIRSGETRRVGPHSFPSYALSAATYRRQRLWHLGCPLIV